MIHKYYEVSCDNCKCLIDYYNFSPSNTTLRKDGCKIKIINGHRYIFCCDECYDKYVNKTNKEN